MIASGLKSCDLENGKLENDLENETISLEEKNAALKSQNEALWKVITQRSLNQEEILAILEENFKLGKDLALHKDEVAGLKLQCEVFTKELESKNNTISDMKTYKKKWKTSLRNLNVKLNELETENEERKQENEHLKLELKTFSDEKDKLLESARIHKQAEFSVKILLEEKSVKMNYLQDQIERLITTALENNKNTIHKHLSDLARKTETCSSLETQLNVLNEQLKAHHILYDEDILQLKEQIDAKEVIIANLIENNSKLNDDIQTITEKAQGFIEKEDKQDKLIKELEETIQRGQQHLLKDINELCGEVRRYQSQAQQDVTAQGLRTECLRCRDTKVTLEKKDIKNTGIFKSLFKRRKTKLEQAAGGKAASSRALRPPLEEDLPSSSNCGSF